jgi:transcriptional regulator with XRE-family HTH domain
MKDRLLKILKQYNLTSTRFADELGVQRSGISHILSGRNQPSYDFIVKLMTQYPEINPDWLLMGKGTMLRTALKEKSSPEPDLFRQVSPGKDEPAYVEPPVIKEDNHQAKVTNVTSIQHIVIFYPDGTFKPYFPVLNE